MFYYYQKFISRAKIFGVKRAFYDSVIFLANRLARGKKLEPYVYIQSDIQENLHKYLHVSKDSITRILIIGAHLGFEVSDLSKRYKSCSFFLFEGSPRYSALLMQKFSRQDRVRVFECLVGDVNSQVDFFETNIEGTGSLLKPTNFAEQAFDMKQTEHFVVPCFRLDTHAKENGYYNQLIDCLWIDVQGAELQVLNGAIETLKTVKSIFIEVSIWQDHYTGSVKMSDLSRFLESNDFQIFGLGIDSNNGTGNAFYINMSLVRFDKSIQ